MNDPHQHSSRMRSCLVCLRPAPAIPKLTSSRSTGGHKLMETGRSPYEGHPYYIMAIIRLLSDIKH